MVVDIVQQVANLQGELQQTRQSLDEAAREAAEWEQRIDASSSQTAAAKAELKELAAHDAENSRQLEALRKHSNILGTQRCAHACCLVGHMLQTHPLRHKSVY